MEEQIIEAVRTHLVLYDTTHSDYMKNTSSFVKKQISKPPPKKMKKKNMMLPV
jgi:hypothetical protein